MGELRERKKRETRERISDIATNLFFERGFDAVTVDEIAAAAKVSKVTVFNYFARKEDLLIDREDDVKQFVRDALANRPKSQSPVDALRQLIDRLVEARSPYARIDHQTAGWWRVVAGSPALQARVRELTDAASLGLAVELAGPEPDGATRLLAGMIVLTWRTAHAEALRAFEDGATIKKAAATFIALIDRGFATIRSFPR